MPIDLLGEAPDESADGKSHMIARINAIAVKMAYPFVAQDDIRYYLCGINVRPLADGTAMLVATNGHQFVVVRDPNGYVEREVIVSINKDALKHATNAKHTLDVMSDGKAMFSGDVAQPLFLQVGNSLLDGVFPRIENVVSTIGYSEGISGAVNPVYLAAALRIGEKFGSAIRFFTRDSDSPLLFVLGGSGELECFGGVMKLRESFDQLPAWFPKPVAPNTLGEL